MCRRFAQSVGEGLRKVVSAGRLQRAVLEESGPWRERSYGPLQTLELFVEQVLSADHSCQDAVARAASARVARGEARGSLSSGPYCKARQRLSMSLVQRLGREVGQALCERKPRVWRWRGREVKLVDGTTLWMPDTASNQVCYPQNRAQAPGLGFPLARLVGIISLSNGAMLHWASGPCEGEGSGETALLWELSARLAAGDIVVADRYYAGYFMVARLQQMGVDVLIRQHRSRRSDFRRGERLGVRDHVVQWRCPARPQWMDEATYEQMPSCMRLREVQVGGWILVSTLRDHRRVSKVELHQLYCQRWKIELDLRAIKSVMQMGQLRCKTPQMVQKEIAAHLLAYNLVRALMAQAAALYQIGPPRELSFKAAVQLINAFHEVLRHAPRSRVGLMQAHLLGAIASRRLPHRPGRAEPRGLKRRKDQHDFLKKPRQQLREQLLKRKRKCIEAALR